MEGLIPTVAPTRQRRLCHLPFGDDAEVNRDSTGGRPDVHDHDGTDSRAGRTRVRGGSGHGGR